MHRNNFVEGDKSRQQSYQHKTVGFAIANNASTVKSPPINHHEPGKRAITVTPITHKQYIEQRRKQDNHDAMVRL